MRLLLAIISFPFGKDHVGWNGAFIGFVLSILLFFLEKRL